MIAIIAAMDKEIEFLKNKAGLTHTRVMNLDCFTGSYAGKELTVIKSGIGKVNAASAATVAAAVFKADCMINTGIAGGNLKIGSVVVADRCVQYDADMTAWGLPLGRIDGYQDAYFKTDAKLNEKIVTALKSAGIMPHIGIAATGDSFVADKQKAEFIARQFNAAAFDMESGALAQICVNANIPFSVIRVISDGGLGADEYERFAMQACKIMSGAVETVLKSL